MIKGFDMYIVAWVIKLVAIQLMLGGILIECFKEGDIHRVILTLGAILFAIGGNLLYVNEKRKGGKK